MPSSNFDPEVYRALVEDNARTFGVDPDLVMKVIHQESAGDPHAVSSAGAQGLMQIMPANQSLYGVNDPFDPAQSVKAGTRMLGELLQKYNGDTRLALIDYNGGPKAVKAYQSGKPFKETAGYLKNILGDSTRPDPFDLDAFVKSHEAQAGGDQPFDLDAFVKSNAPQPTGGERALGDLNAISEAVKESLPAHVYDATAGALKGLGSTVYRLSGAKQFMESPEGQKITVGDTPASKVIDAGLTPVGGDQRLAHAGEQAAEFAFPATGADMAVMKLTGAASPAVRFLLRSAAQGGVGAGVAAAHGENPKTGAIVGATGPTIGALAEQIGPVIRAAGRGLIRSSLKPTYSLLSKLGGFEGAEPHADELVKFIQDNHLGSPAEAEAFIKQLESQEILPAARAAGARGVRMTGTAGRIQQAVGDYGDSGVTTAVLGKDKVKAASTTLKNLENSGLFHDVQVSTPQPPAPGAILGPNGQPILVTQPPLLTTVRAPRTDVTPEQLLTGIRESRYTPRTVGTKLAPADEANNIALQTARADLKRAAPETVPAFEKERMAINAKQVLDRGLVREGNKDLLPFKAALTLGKDAAAGNVIAVGAGVLRAVGGVRAGLWATKLSEALGRNDVRAVAQIVRGMGYGAALDATPQQGGAQ